MIECLFCIALSPFFSTYDDSIHSSRGFHFAVAEPVYVWGSYEKLEYRIVGQQMPMSTPGAGIGYKKGPVFVEVGRWWPKLNTADEIEQEIVLTTLRNVHGLEPFAANYRDYQVQPGWGGRVGLELEVKEWFGVFAALRFVSFSERYVICSEDPACEYPVSSGGQWIHEETMSGTSLQVGVTVRL